ncbi:hypothetical protein ABIA33_007423 [Streptacidiphilus sp. MAP12-16]|uniref:hypothetical protein n=1 Tax=Streptacidiphilus sp. MAP12-16 TaxID=3156300 RepID=UPI003514CC2E
MRSDRALGRYGTPEASRHGGRAAALAVALSALSPLGLVGRLDEEPGGKETASKPTELPD